MAKQLTIKDIAKYCGVGVSTVSRSINGDTGVSDVTRKRVLDAVRKFHYVPNAAARNLKISESNTIALLVSGVDNVFFQSMFDQFQGELTAAGFDFMLHFVDEHSSIAHEAVEVAKEKRLKGIIIMGGRMENPEKELEQLTIPYVLCTVAHSMYTPVPQVNSVAIDDEAESYNAVKYLISKGHKRIAIVTGHKDDLSVGGQRLSGYKKALNEAGIPVDEDLIGYMTKDITEFTVENGYAVTKELLGRAKFTALYCISDMTAFGAYKAVAEAGLRIPDDLSVIGFDGINLGKFMVPSLTTIEQPRESLVRSSVDLLVGAIKGDEDTKQLIYPARLIERDSVR